MSNFLSSPQWKEIMNDYGLWWDEELESRQLINTITIDQLFQHEQCEQYLTWLARHIGAPSLHIAGSMLIKRYAFLLIAPVMYAMTYYNRGVWMNGSSLQLITIKAEPDYPRSPFPDLQLPRQQLQVTVPEPYNRERWRAEVIRELFEQHLSPLMRAVAAVSPISIATLWENVMVRIAPLYADDEAADPELLERIKDDFSFIVSQASGELYGMRKNPFTVFTQRTDDKTIEAKPKRLTCCLYYLMAPEYCRKCPKTGTACC